MKKIIMAGLVTCVIMLTGCAVGPTKNQTNNQMSGVTTQSKTMVNYTSGQVNQQAQQGKSQQQGHLIPFTYIGKPNEVHYFDTTQVKTVTTYNQQGQNYQNNNNYNANNDAYSNSNYENNNVPQNQNMNVLNSLFNKLAPRQNNLPSNGNYQRNNYKNTQSGSGISYVAPTTRAPGYGYEWKYNPQTGWNWFNPQYGWY